MDSASTINVGACMTSDDKPAGRAIGGVARAKSLAPERRREIAREAAARRWGTDSAQSIAELPQATHEAPLNLAGQEVFAAVLGDGRRLLLSRDFLTALGRPWKGTYRRTKYPSFIDANNLSPFVTSDLEDVLEPVEFKTMRGQKAIGYRAELLPEVISVYQRARVAGALKGRQREIADKAEILGRGLMRLGIIGLVDEVTGYQAVRAKDDLARILSQFIAKELQPYVQTFDAEFYQEMFRLRGLEWSSDSVKRPQYFGTLTNEVIYKRLAPGVLEELKKVTPRNDSGKHKDKLFRRLTSNRGYPKLKQLLGSVVTLMTLSSDWHDFMQKLERRHPKFTTQLSLPFPYQPDKDDGKGL